MTDCTNDRMRDLLPDLLHGRLAAVDRGALEAHLRSCAACAAELTLLRDARTAMADVPAVDVAAIVRALPRPSARPGPTLVVSPSPAAPAVGVARAARWRRPVYWAPAAALAATLLLAVGIPVASRYGADAGTGSVAATAGDTGAARPAATVAHAGGSTVQPAARSWLSDLPSDEISALIDELETVEALPTVEPEPVLVNVGTEEAL